MHFARYFDIFHRSVKQMESLLIPDRELLSSKKTETDGSISEWEIKFIYLH